MLASFIAGLLDCACQWSVMQYVIVRPLITIVAIVCQAMQILCESAGFDFHYANPYLDIFDAVSVL